MRSATRTRPDVRATLRWSLFIVVPASVWPILTWLHSEVPPANAHVLREARFFTGGETEPAEEQRRLPHDWRTTRRGIVEGSYELAFRTEHVEPEDWAVYLPSLSMNAAVYLNGHFLGDGGSLADPVARNWSRPLLFRYPSAFLSRKENTLRVKLRADLPDTGFLGVVHVGPHRALARTYAHRYRLKITAVWVLTLCLVMVGIFMVALWTAWREEASYGWFAASAFAWALIHLNVLIVDIPVGTLTWYGLWYAALGWWAVLLNRFLLSLLGEKKPLLERGLTALAFSGTATVALLTVLGSSWLPAVIHVWMTLAFVAGAYTNGGVLRYLRDRKGEIGAALPHVLGWSVVVCGLHDWPIFVGLGDPTLDYYLPYAAAPVLAGMGSALLGRFIGALRQSESLVVDLESRVRAKREELAQSYERLRDVERSRVLAEERERIMREMHDGLGSHLVSTLSLIEGEAIPREAVGRAIRAALDDLRLMIDSLGPLEGDLVGTLAMLRARMQPRLEAAGIDVAWHVDDLPAIPDFGPQKILHVMRILQESVTNVMKHAGARTITIRTGDDEPSAGHRRIFVEIVDDGRGIGETGAGRGLHHMRARAAAIGAVLEVRGSAHGTSVRLLIPLGEAAAA